LLLIDINRKYTNKKEFYAATYTFFKKIKNQNRTGLNKNEYQ